MSTSARADIFAHLREVCAGTPAAEVERLREAIGPAPRSPPGDAPLAESFLGNVLRNRGTADCAADRGGVVRAVAAYLYEHLRSHRLVAGNDARLAAMPWRDAGVLPRFGSIEETEPAAVSFARLAVAELGAVVCFTGRGSPARNNLLPEHHIVIVDVADLVDSAEEAWSRIARAAGREHRPRGIQFIAGPSSTADIEGQLVYGAHGPRHWHVILQGAVAEGTLARARERAGQAS